MVAAGTFRARTPHNSSLPLHLDFSEPHPQAHTLPWPELSGILLDSFGSRPLSIICTEQQGRRCWARCRDPEEESIFLVQDLRRKAGNKIQRIACAGQRRLQDHQAGKR